MFREYVSKFFDIVKRGKSRGATTLWKMFDDKKQPWKPWKDHEHRSLHSWEPWHEYWHLQIRTSEIGGKVREAFEVAITTRDSFLMAACNIMNEVIVAFARERGIEMHDKIRDGILLQREFVGPKEDTGVRILARSSGGLGPKKKTYSFLRLLNQGKRIFVRIKKEDGYSQGKKQMVQGYPFAQV